MHVICVTFDIKPEALEAFLPLMKAQAANSLRYEPECHLFEVCQAKDDPARVFLYEVYTDSAAFEAHLASPHFKTFDAAVAPMIVSKDVEVFHRLAPSSV